jgi:hypothetical protein
MKASSTDDRLHGPGRFRKRRRHTDDDAPAALSAEASAHRASPRTQYRHRGAGCDAGGQVAWMALDVAGGQLVIPPSLDVYSSVAKRQYDL